METPTERKFSSSQGANPCRLTAIPNAVPSEAVTARHASSGLLLTNTHWATEGQKEFQEHIFWERGMSSHQVYKTLQCSPPRFYELSISCRKKHGISINAPHITSQKEKISTATKTKEWLLIVCQLPKPDLLHRPPEQILHQAFFTSYQNPAHTATCGYFHRGGQGGRINNQA